MLELDRILSGMIRVLEDRVLPELSSGYARGQLHAVLELLENLQGRTVWGGPLLEGEAAMLESLAAEAVGKLTDPRGSLAARLRDYVAAPPSSLGERIHVGRALVCELVAGGHADQGALATLVDGYLTNDAVMKALGLKPSRLSEISRG